MRVVAIVVSHKFNLTFKIFGTMSRVVPSARRVHHDSRMVSHAASHVFGHEEEQATAISPSAYDATSFVGE